MPFAGVRAMQICVLKGVPDSEILEACNRENPQAAQFGWNTVARSKEHAKQLHLDEMAAPRQCAVCPDREYKIVVCL